MKRISCLLFSAFLATHLATEAVDVDQVRSTLDYAASDQTVLTDSLYNAATAQLNQLSPADQQALAGPVEAVVEKRVESMLHDQGIWGAVGAAALGGIQAGIIGSTLAILPEIYQETCVDRYFLAEKAVAGFVTGALAGLGKHLLEKTSLKTSLYASAAVQGVSNLVLQPSGTSRLATSLTASATGLLTQAAKKALDKAAKKAGGFFSFLISSPPSYETAQTQEAKALTKPDVKSTAVQTQYGALINDIVPKANAAYRTCINLPKVVTPPVQSMIFGALVGVTLDKVLNISFFPRLGWEYYAIFGAMQGLITAARRYNYQINLPAVLAINTFPILLLSYLGKSPADAPPSLAIAYSTLVPIVSNSVVELAQLFGGWTSLFKQIASELSPADDALMKLCFENLGQLAQRV